MTLPLDVPRTYPPTWTDELRIALLRPGQAWGAKETLDLISAVAEFESWLNDSRLYDGQHKRSWLSMIDDFRHSASHIGPKLADVIVSDLDEVIATANAIKTDLDSQNTTTLQALLPSRLPAARIACSRLMARWTDPAVREAAWLDFVDACRDPATSFDTLALRRDLFWKLLRAADYSSDELSQLLAMILSDIEFYIIRARLWLGDVSESEVAWPAPARDAGLTNEQQLTLCQRIVTKSPEQAQHIVWVAFDRTGLGGSSFTIGPVSFWNCEWVRAVLEQGGPNLEHIPSELRGGEGLFRYYNLPLTRDVMLARVDLDSGAFTDPVRIAFEQAEAVVAVAGFRLGQTVWRRIDGYLHAIDGRIRGIGSFTLSRDIIDEPNSLYHDAMELELESLAPRLASHLPIVDPILTEVIQGVRWWETARKQTALAALLLHVRILDLLAARVYAGPWPEYIDSYLRATWIRQTIIGLLGNVLSDTVFRYEHLVSENDQQIVKDLSAAITSWPKARQALDLKRGIAGLPDLARIFPRHDALGRRIQSIAKRLDSPASLMTWCEELSEDWQFIAGRLRRIRNALAHGGPLQDSAAETVHGFAQHLAAWSLSTALEGILDGKSIAVAHDEYRRESNTWLNSIPSASDVGEALFPS